MKKISVILILLILLLGTIGIGSVLGCAIPYFEPQQTTVHVGEFFTVVAINHGTNCINPEDIEVYEAENCPSILSDKVVFVSSQCDGNKLTVTYRAVKQGAVKFNYITCSKEVIILPKPHPMFSFMKILGFGKSN